jgi:transposase InsO family protein
VIKMLSESNLPITKACKVLDLNRSNYYNWKTQPVLQDKDAKLREAIQEIALEFIKYGYRRITADLHRKNWKVNSKKVLRIMREENLLCSKKKFTPHTTNSNHNLPLYPNLTKELEITGLNQLWVADITYIQLGKEFVYLAAIIEIYSRKCVGWDLSRNIDAKLAIKALDMAITARASIGFKQLIHHSDRGVQYASKEYVAKLTIAGIKVSMTETGNPRENAYAESFMKTLKYEEVYLKEYDTFEDAYKNLKEFIEEVYNAKRLHSSIGYIPPNERETEVLNIR